jgi:hypothetical protein
VRRQYRNYSRAGMDWIKVFERVDSGLETNPHGTRKEVAEEYGIHPHALGRRYSPWVKGGGNCDGTTDTRADEVTIVISSKITVNEVLSEQRMIDVEQIHLLVLLVHFSLTLCL